MLLLANWYRTLYLECSLYTTILLKKGGRGIVLFTHKTCTETKLKPWPKKKGIDCTQNCVKNKKSTELPMRTKRFKLTERLQYLKFSLLANMVNEKASQSPVSHDIHGLNQHKPTSCQPRLEILSYRGYVITKYGQLKIRKLSHGLTCMPNKVVSECNLWRRSNSMKKWLLELIWIKLYAC